MNLAFFGFLVMSIAILFISEIARRKLNLPTEITRRATHVVAAFIAAISSLFLDKWLIVVGCLLFAGIMFLSRRTSLFNSIQKVKRKSLGEVFLPLSEAITALIFLPIGRIEFQYGVLVMGLSDPLAGFIGTRFGKHEIKILGNTKSLEGSLSFFLCTLMLTLVFAPTIGINLLILPLLLTLIEICLGYGTDNLVLPIAGATLLSFCI